MNHEFMSPPFPVSIQIGTKFNALVSRHTQVYPDNFGQRVWEDCKTANSTPLTPRYATTKTHTKTIEHKKFWSPFYGDTAKLKPIYISHISPTSDAKILPKSCALYVSEAFQSTFAENWMAVKVCSQTLVCTASASGNCGSSSVFAPGTGPGR